MSKCTRPNKINHYHDNNAINHHYRHHHYHSIEMANQSNNKNLTNGGQKKIAADKTICGALSGQISNNNNNRKLATKTTSRYHNLQSKGYKSLLSSFILNNNSNNNYNIIINKNSKPAAFFGSTKFLLISTIFLFTILSVILLDHQVYSLNCYHCSSVDNPNCDESFTGRDNFSLPADTDCSKHIGREAKVCRKIVQYIEHKKVVIRSCGYIDEPSSTPTAQQLQQQQQPASTSGDHGTTKKSMCFKRSGTFAIMMESCNCYTDNCNHSTSLKPTQSVLFLSSCFVIIMMILFTTSSSVSSRTTRLTNAR